MIRLWTLIFKGNSVWLRKASSKTDLKIAIKNVWLRTFSVGGLGFIFGGVCLTVCNTSFWIWLIVVSIVQYLLYSFWLLPRADFTAARNCMLKVWRLHFIQEIMKTLHTHTPRPIGKLWKTQVRKCVTQEWNVSKYQKTNWRSRIFVTSLKKEKLKSLYFNSKFLFKLSNTECFLVQVKYLGIIQ